MSYERKDYEVLRDGVVVANINPVNGTLEYAEDCKKYHTHVVKLLQEENSWNSEKGCVIIPDATNDPLKSGTEETNKNPGAGTPPETPKAVTTGRINTTIELIKAMQPMVKDPCPPMTHWEGDRTPAVLAWIQNHDDVRRQVFKASIKAVQAAN